MMYDRSRLMKSIERMLSIVLVCLLCGIIKASTITTKESSPAKSINYVIKHSSKDFTSDNDSHRQYPITVEVAITINRHFSSSTCDIDEIVQSFNSTSSPTIPTDKDSNLSTWTVTVSALDEATMITKRKRKNVITSKDYTLHERQRLSFVPVSISKSSHKEAESPALSKTTQDGLYSITFQSLVQFNLTFSLSSTMQSSRSSSTQQSQNHNHQVFNTQRDQKTFIIVIQTSKMIQNDNNEETNTYPKKQHSVIMDRTVRTIKVNRNIKPLIVNFNHNESIIFNRYCKQTQNNHDKKYKERLICLNNDNVDASFHQLVRGNNKNNDTCNPYEGWNNTIKHGDQEETLMFRLVNVWIMILCFASLSLFCLIMYLLRNMFVYLLIDRSSSISNGVRVEPNETIAVNTFPVKRESNESSIHDQNNYVPPFTRSHFNTRRLSIIVIDDSDDEDEDLSIAGMSAPPTVRRKYDPDLFPLSGSYDSQQSMRSNCSNKSLFHFFDNTNASQHSNQISMSNTKITPNQKLSHIKKASLPQENHTSMSFANMRKVSAESNKGKAMAAVCQSIVVASHDTMNVDDTLYQPNNQNRCLSNELLHDNLQWIGREYTNTSSNIKGPLNHDNSSNLPFANIRKVSIESNKAKASTALCQSVVVACQYSQDTMEVDRKSLNSKRNIRELHQDTPDTLDTSSHRSSLDNDNVHRIPNYKQQKILQCKNISTNSITTTTQRSPIISTQTRQQSLSAERSEGEKENINVHILALSKSAYNSTETNESKKYDNVDKDTLNNGSWVNCMISDKEHNKSIASGGESKVMEVKYLDDVKMALSPFTTYPPERNFQPLVPPPPSTSAFKPSSELISASKAVQSPVWEFNSYATSAKKKSSKRQHVSSQSQGQASSNIPSTKRKRSRTRSRRRTRSKSPINMNIPHTILITANINDNDDALTLPADSSIDNSNARKRGMEEVDFPNESRIGGSNGSSKRSQAY